MGTIAWIGPKREFVYVFNNTADAGGIQRRATEDDTLGSDSGFHGVPIDSREAAMAVESPNVVYGVEKYSKPTKGLFGESFNSVGVSDKIRIYDAKKVNKIVRTKRISPREVREYIKKTTVSPTPEFYSDSTFIDHTPKGFKAFLKRDVGITPKKVTVVKKHTRKTKKGKSRVKKHLRKVPKRKNSLKRKLKKF